MNHIKIFVCLLLVMSSCTSTRKVPVETICHDTVYLNTFRYDSTYVSHDRIEKDTLIHSSGKGELEGVLIRERDVEYRYRLLRDTIRIVRRDSIPYEVIVCKEPVAPKPSLASRLRAWLDHIARTTLLILLASLLLYLRFRK